MFFGLFKRKPPFDPPTEQQIAYAARLGLRLTPDMDKERVSEAIGKFEAANPKAKRQREHIAEKQAAAASKKWIEECGEELIAAETSWAAVADADSYILAVYRDRKGIVVDVLQVNDASIEGAKKKHLVLTVAAPKLRKDQYIGSFLEWERDFELRLDHLLYHEVMTGTFDYNDIARYQAAVNRGLEIANRIAK